MNVQNLSPELRAKMQEDDDRAKTPEGRYGLGKRIEYRVRPVTRYVVTKFEKDVEPEGYGSAGGGGSQVSGEYGNYETAYSVAYALCKADHERLGYAPDDDRIQYPKPDLERIDSALSGSLAGDTFG